MSKENNLYRVVAGTAPDPDKLGCVYKPLPRPIRVLLANTLLVYWGPRGEGQWFYGEGSARGVSLKVAQRMLAEVRLAGGEEDELAGFGQIRYRVAKIK
jgi:hypothetical protein